MLIHRTIQNLERIGSTFQTMRWRYIALLTILAGAMVLGQWLIQQKLVQIGTTYEALSDIQQLYEVGNLLQPKGLMIAATQNEIERKQQIQGFANNVDMYSRICAFSLSSLKMRCFTVSLTRNTSWYSVLLRSAAYSCK